MKCDYDKLHRRYVRHNHERHKDSDQSEVKKMSTKLEVENFFVNVIIPRAARRFDRNESTELLVMKSTEWP